MMQHHAAKSVRTEGRIMPKQTSIFLNTEDREGYFQV